MSDTSTYDSSNRYAFCKIRGTFHTRARQPIIKVTSKFLADSRQVLAISKFCGDIRACHDFVDGPLV